MDICIHICLSLISVCLSVYPSVRICLRLSIRPYVKCVCVYMYNRIVNWNKVTRECLKQLRRWIRRRNDRDDSRYRKIWSPFLLDDNLYIWEVCAGTNVLFSRCKHRVLSEPLWARCSIVYFRMDTTCPLPAKSNSYGESFVRWMACKYKIATINLSIIKFFNY